MYEVSKSKGEVREDDGGLVQRLADTLHGLTKHFGRKKEPYDPRIGRVVNLPPSVLAREAAADREQEVWKNGGMEEWRDMQNLMRKGVPEKKAQAFGRAQEMMQIADGELETDLGELMRLVDRAMVSNPGEMKQKIRDALNDLRVVQGRGTKKEILGLVRERNFNLSKEEEEIEVRVELGRRMQLAKRKLKMLVDQLG